MLTEVRQSWEGGWVTHVANMDIQGSGRLVCCLIRNQQNLDKSIVNQDDVLLCVDVVLCVHLDPIV